MIVFDLRCSGEHVFEAWFASSGAFEDQRARGLLSCPLCGDVDIGKAVMAPNIPAKGNRKDVDAPVTATEAPTPAAMKAAIRALAEAQARALEKSEWVGRAFADRARAMHAGDADPAPIHGEATIGEAKALADEGVAIAPLPFPVVPPEAIN
ncbi:DUF1178 family protein [Sphingomonas sp. QA11]|uniref:DUF1178 family protein n=1 Tax=Sphingomonas sp. QA11 TaxID=2950605 RepID=UPI00234BD205|nr:DUF1178 family protein [Sphingomonas sp. QA11]WCM29310.1 DUF1178 family protein [Sphingomonas sp. QA11]